MAILTFDIGNTHTVIGVFRGTTLVRSWRMKTDTQRTSDETTVLLHSLFTLDQGTLDDVEDAVICSVVPPALPSITEFCRRRFGRDPLVVDLGIKTGVIVRYENPKEVGADRIVNAVAGIHSYGLPLIVVDLGTATTFDCVSRKGEYLGGAICPGVAISAEALFQRAAKLPRIDIARPPSVLGRTTVHSMQSGLFFGTLSMVEGMILRLKQEMGEDTTAITTGGLGSLIAEQSPLIAAHDPHLTLTGLRLLYERNRGKIRE